MSTKGDHPTKAQASVPPKPDGHDQMPLYKRMAGTTKRFIKRDPQLAPLAAITLGTVGLWMYFHQSKVTEVAKETGLPRHKDTKAAGRGSDAPTATGEAPLSRNQYHAESSSAPSGVASYLLPNLDKSDREDLDNLTVGSDSGRFGRTIKQAARYDQRKKDRDFEEKLKQYQDAASGKAEGEEGDPPARSKDHLRDLQAHKRTT